MTSKILFEVCCGSIDDAIEVQAGGADRIELNSCLFHGGLTPPIGSVIEARKRLQIPIIAMVRPRGGGFCYTEAEFAQMEHDARMFIEQGADGIVFGILNQDGSIDMQRNARLVEIAGDRDAVFHRAFDVTGDPFKALDQLIELGIKRVLTSGQQPSVPLGVEMLKQLVEYAKGRIEILPGGGIELHNAKEMADVIGCGQIHLAWFKSMRDSSCSLRPQIFFGGALYPPEDRYDVIDQDYIQNVTNRLSD